MDTQICVHGITLYNRSELRYLLLSCIIPTLFVYFLACHPYIFLHFYFLVYINSHMDPDNYA